MLAAGHPPQRRPGHSFVALCGNSLCDMTELKHCCRPSRICAAGHLLRPESVDRFVVRCGPFFCDARVVLTRYLSGPYRFLSGSKSDPAWSFVSEISDELPENVCRSGFIEKFCSREPAICSSSTIKLLVIVSARQTTENNSSNSSIAMSECLIIPSLLTDIQGGRIDQENQRDFSFREPLLKTLF